MTDWTEAKNDRRCDLIDRDAHNDLTSSEAVELVGLQNQLREYIHTVAPLPIAEVTALHNELKAKNERRCHQKDGQAVLSELYLETPEPIPKQPLQSKLFKTGLTMLLVGLFEVIRAIVVERSWPGAAEITAAIGGAATMIFRRFTYRPMTFTRRGQHDGGNWQP